MIKTLGLFLRKPGMTRADFIDRYESPEYGHAQFAIKICPWQEDYRRNFVCDEPPIVDARLPGSGKRPAMDVVMITKSRDLAQAQLTADALSDPAVGARIARDEEALFDRTKMTIVNVEERASSEDALRSAPAVEAEDPPLKVLVFARKCDAAQSHEAFAQAYEEQVASLLERTMRNEGAPFLAGYRRNYVNHDAFANQGHIAVAPPKADFDVMSELWFWSEEDLRRYQQVWDSLVAGPELREAMSRVIDPASHCEVFVEEYVHTPAMLSAALAAHDALAAARD